VALVLASAAGGRTSVAESAPLIFGRSLGNIEAIYAVAGDGTHLTQLSEGPNDSDPAWSPDGSQIAYLRDNGARGLRRHSVDLVVMDATGRNPRRLTRGALIPWFSWSPDSNQIAVADDRRGLDVVDVVTRSVRSLSRDEVFGPPLWSPDGQMILFEPGDDHDLTVISLADGSSQQLSGTESSDAYAWAPRGRVIAYSVSDDLFLAEPGGMPVRVASLTDPEELAWSPDGTRIALTSDPLGEAQVWVLRFPDTLTRVTNARGCDEAAPAWSPDSDAMAFRRSGCVRRSNVGLYRVNANGAGERRIAVDDPWIAPAPASWDPLGRAVPGKPQLAPPDYLTQIYDARGRRFAYIVRKATNIWAVSWAAYANHEPTFVTRSGSRLAAECDIPKGGARRLSPRRWRVSSGGEIRRVGTRRWNVYNRLGRKIASTSGADGPVAGFAWLTLRGC
jgi:dipeptidyl aminopeptidase/acylaminoacyl peptidase